MPIVFEQPDAIGTAAGQAAATGYGTAIQGDKDRQFYLQALAQSGKGAEATARQSAINAQLGASWSQAGEQQHAQGQQADMVAQQQINQQNAQAAQQAQAEQMQANTFTYQDSVRLNQMQNAVSAVQNDPSLSPQEKAEYMLQIKTGIDPMKKRQQAAQLQQQQAETEKVVQAGRLESVQLKTAMDFVAENPSGVKNHPDGSKSYFDGHTVKYEPPPKPEPYTDPFGEEGGTGKSKAAGATGGVDMAAVSKNAMEASKNAEGQVDPDKYAANLQKFSKIHQDLHDSIHQQGQQQLAQEIVTDNLTSPGGVAALKGPQLRTHIKALNKLVGAPAPTDADAAQQQADAITGTYPNPQSLPQQNPGAARRLKELNAVVNKAKTDADQRRANVPDPNAQQQNDQQQPAAPQQEPWRYAYEQHVKEYGNKPGYFTVLGKTPLSNEKYYVNEKGQVAKVTEPGVGDELKARFPSGLKAWGELFRKAATDAGDQ